MKTLDYSGPIAEYFQASEAITGWLRGEAAKAVAAVVWALPADCVIVEIGSFLGSGSVLLAGTLKLRGSGKLHCVEPFDGSGDSYSKPVYAEVLKAYGDRSLRQCFDDHI